MSNAMNKLFVRRWNKAVWLVLPAICLLASPIRTEAEGISESALAQIRAMQQEKASRPALHSKLDSQLIFAIRKSRNELAAFGLTHLKPNVKVEPDGRVLLDITAHV